MLVYNRSLGRNYIERLQTHIKKTNIELIDDKVIQRPDEANNCLKLLALNQIAKPHFKQKNKNKKKTK